MPETVGVVVVNWNGLADTRACLRSIAALDPPVGITVVVDNGSTDDSVTALRAEFPDVSVVTLGVNRGYAAAANIGVQHVRDAGAQYAWLLNNDTTVEPGTLSALLAAAKAIAAPALLAPKILDARGRIWSAGGELRWPWLERSHIGAGADRNAYDEMRRVAWASGCSLFFPCDVFDQIGPIDERYFLYVEDVDWCLRARRHGVPVWFVPQARITHGVSRSVGAADPRLLRYYACRNYYMLVRRHAGIAGRAWASGRFALTAVKAALRLLVSAEHRRDPMYAAQTRALLDVARRRGGPAPYPHERATAASRITAGATP